MPLPTITHALAALAVAGVVALTHTAMALDNGLARTPALGFNTWNYWACDINETVIRETADKVIELGLADLGYVYINIDDCWHSMERDANGRLVPEPERFPSGMSALGDYIHGKGLKLGIYSDGGLKTCAGYPGSRGHEVEDAATWAEWGVDYLKYDNCYAASSDVVERYTAMRDALNATGRPILFSMCEWGVANPWRWAPQVGNSWRTDSDISPSWNSILRCLDNGIVGLSQFAGPGGWNDPDMLEVGNGDLPSTQQRAHFALWSLAKSPLLISTDLGQISNISLDVLKAEEVIALNQDPMGVPGDLIWKEGPLEIYAAPLDNDERGIILFTRHWVGSPTDITVHWEQVGWDPDTVAEVRDLYARRDLGVFTGSFTAKQLDNGDVAVLRVKQAVAPSAAGQAVDAAADTTTTSSSSKRSSSWRPWHAPRLRSGAPVCSQPATTASGDSTVQGCASSSKCPLSYLVCQARQLCGKVHQALAGSISKPSPQQIPADAVHTSPGQQAEAQQQAEGMMHSIVACSQPPVWWAGAMEATAKREAAQQRFMQSRGRQQRRQRGQQQGQGLGGYRGRAHASRAGGRKRWMAPAAAGGNTAVA